MSWMPSPESPAKRTTTDSTSLFLLTKNAAFREYDGASGGLEWGVYRITPAIEQTGFAGVELMPNIA
jgi:hypothetical protein